MAVLTEFVTAINQISSERGIDPESVYKALENAILIAYKKETGMKDVECLSVEIDRDTAEFRLISKKEVVKKVDDEISQMSQKEAQKIDPELKVGDFVEVEMPSKDLGRIAAQTAKQVILQNISELEKEAILEEFSGKVGEVFTALMQRMQKDRAVFEIGKASAYMPTAEQIPGEFYKIGERYKVLLKEIAESGGNKELIISRSGPEFLSALFEMEVPEIGSGVIEIKSVAREAGSRSKIAVSSNQEGIDPIGSCVGQKGVRIQNIMEELGEERIDIIEWDEELESFIRNSLNPAKINEVEIEDEVAHINVDEDQLSLAIGKDGQNVRLAAKLTGYKIDIQAPDGTKKMKVDEHGEESYRDEDVEKIGEEEDVDETKEEDSTQEVVNK